MTDQYQPAPPLPPELPDSKGYEKLEDGTALGNVDNLLATGANDVLVVKGDRECLVPFVQGQYVKKVDLENGVITVDWDPDF